ncbi:HAD-IC family P-type ATPase [Bifidobacterium choloepi]|uniref:HAD-IC family P-type ATPase n=1 Tax=Bifidobacterium choloepi TaxID=2614131 RepID=A0A6I5N0K2_9BIFI|nr:HAD-IC family P-type ATPase [Bifidobacterium choloepi]NEG70107.1 HAD-IC family P-type ATPase [Bifidobacterium choloepi]
MTSPAAAPTTPTSPRATLPDVAEAGLSDAAVADLIAAGQTNAVKDKPSRSLAHILRENIFTLFNGIIFTAMVFVLLTGSWKDAVFGFVILVNTGIGIATELRAKHTLDRLSILVESTYTVRRGGHNIDVDHNDIVLGDLLWLKAGDQVPSDATIVDSWGVELDESMITGESRTIRKRPGDGVYSGSTVVSGLALAKVTAVGAHSYAAELTAQAKVYKKNISDLNRGINAILKFMTFLVVPLCILLICSQMGTVGGWSEAIATGAWREAVVSSVAGVVGMIPEGLVLLTSLNFALAAIRLARKNTLVQDLDSVETLARVDALNLDKTGTITDGTIQFDSLHLLPHGAAADSGVPALADAETPADLLADNVRLVSADPAVVFEKLPTDGSGSHDSSATGAASATAVAAATLPGEREIKQALYDLANEGQPNGTGQAVLDGLKSRGFAAGHVHVRVPFSSARKWSAVAYLPQEFPTAAGIWTMGAPEVLLSTIAGDHRALLERVNDYAGHGSRVLLVAYEPYSAMNGGTIPADFADHPRLSAKAIPMAIVLCSEHIRDDAEKTLAWFRSQGVRCRVISGDNPVTVGAIAAKVKLTGDREPRAMDARDLPKDIGELAKVIDDIDVLGRVLPDQKKAIVEALHARGHTVAMTGDGVNDTLAIKEADLGIAMGNAAPATKAVAEVVLVDSRFSHLPDVVARGRQVMANMERVASLFLTKTVYSALISFGVVLTGISYPYLPRHISYIGALTIGIPAFILALAPNTRRYRPGFLKRVFAFALPCGIATALSVLLTAWTIPMAMHWNIDQSAADLTQLRSCCAMILFVMGVFVLGRVARPLNSWRGLLVAAFAAIGIAGPFIPFVSHFFQLFIPGGKLLAATGLALVGSAALFFLFLWLMPRILPRNDPFPWIKDDDGTKHIAKS